MSYFILNQLRCCRSRFNIKNGYGLATPPPSALQLARFSTTNIDDENGCEPKKRAHSLGQAVILVQQGIEIQELPIILRKYGQNDITPFCSNDLQLNRRHSTDNKQNSKEKQHEFHFGKSKPKESTQCDENYDDVAADTQMNAANSSSTNVVINPITDTDTIIKLLEKCDSSESVLNLIASIPTNELEQDALVFAMDKIIRIEPMNKLKCFETANENYQHLLNVFCKRCDTLALLNALAQLQSMLFMNQSIDQLCDEILLRNADGYLSVIEMCEAVSRFVECQRFDRAEKFWAGLSDADASINEDNIKFIFEILPKLKVSRKMIIGILDRRIVEIFSFLKPNAVCDIIDSIKQCPNGHTNRTLKAISRWLNINIHAATETHLERILHCMTIINYSDSDIENAIERYIKAKATKIKAQTLIVEILNHMSKFRLLNAQIYNGCAEFFIKNAHQIDPGYVRQIVYPFGLLHFQPFRTGEFWQSIENYVNQNFNKIPAVHIIDIMMAAIYLELYPVNFIDRVFNRYFMHILHTTVPINELAALRDSLKLLDTAMTLECNEYKGPMLPRQINENPLIIENRIKRLINDNIDIIQLIAGDEASFTVSTIPKQLPYTNLYAIDILFHPPGLSLLLNYNMLNDRNIYVAALIHLPEHYDSSGKYLTGEQQMRIRHLRRIGLKVVSLQYTVMAKLSMHRKELHEYFVKQMKLALPATEINTNCVPNVTDD